MRAALGTGSGRSSTDVSSQNRIDEVAQRASRRLGGSTHPGLRGVSCQCDGGALTLRGEVTSFYLKQLAQSLVAELPEVTHILNQIHVVDRPRSAPR